MAYYNQSYQAWHPEYDVKYGNPLSQLHVNGSHYYRELGNTHVHLDCSKGGTGAQVVPKGDATLMKQHATLMARWH